jgi:anti-sigma factor RsiW
MKTRSSAMSERLEAFARRAREVQKWKVLYGEKQRLLAKSLKNSTRLMIELIQLERQRFE